MQYLSIDEVAEALHVNRKTIYMLVRNGKIPAIRIGVQWRIPESFLKEGTGSNKKED